jgi:hypothetical protein
MLGRMTNLLSHELALASTRRLARVLGLFDLGNHLFKCLGDILVRSCARFRKATIVLLRELLATRSWYLSLVGLGGVKVALVPNNDQGNPFCALQTVISKAHYTRISNSGVFTRWLRILSRIIGTISNDCFEATE